MGDGRWHPWDEPGDDDAPDDLAALDVPVPDEESSGLEAFDDYVAADEDDGDGGGAFVLPDSDEEQELSSPLYTVSNPSGTVAVTAYLNGRIQRIELTERAADMSEAALAEEIQVIADLARRKARSELHAFIVEGVRVLGYDPAVMRDSLIRDLDMPTPEQAAEATATVFATRYAADRD